VGAIISLVVAFAADPTILNGLAAYRSYSGSTVGLVLWSRLRGNRQWSPPSPFLASGRRLSGNPANQALQEL